ncbi:MAG: YwaF family protein [Firmicutes bacterium]|nr:YwaF family protein [Bacillota bacterium]
MWQVIDAIVVVLLFAIVILVYEIKRRRARIMGHDVLRGQEITTFDALVHISIGLFFAVTYLAFRYFHTPWTFFGFLHAYGLIATFIMPFALAYLCKGTKQAKFVACVMAGVLLLSPLTRPIIMPQMGTRNTVASWEYGIPFNLCNISALLFLAAILVDNKMFKNFMITMGVFGGIINNTQIHNVNSANYFWFYHTWESYFVHALLIIIPLFMILTGQIKPCVKHALVNMIWLIPVYLLAGFVLNPLWGTNFHFTRPIAVVENIIPSMSSPWVIFDSYVDPLYMGGLFVLVIISCVILYLFSAALYKWVRPKFVND